MSAPNLPRSWISMAGGGSIPLESVRLAFRTWANDLNPVAGLILRATVEWPAQLGYALLDEFGRLASTWRAQLHERLATVFPPSPIKDGVDLTYLWACNDCLPLL